MIYTKGTNEAMKLAYRLHFGQVDKSGAPYIFHPMAVAAGMETEAETIVALLHDVLEDCDITAALLLEAGFTHEVVEAVEAITKREGEKYGDYIARVKENPIARKVKIADLKHNMDLSRLSVITDQDKKRVEKYKKVLEVLNE